jgi:hypothetical protein
MRVQIRRGPTRGGARTSYGSDQSQHSSNSRCASLSFICPAPREERANSVQASIRDLSRHLIGIDLQLDLDNIDAAL